MPMKCLRVLSLNESTTYSGQGHVHPGIHKALHMHKQLGLMLYLIRCLTTQSRLCSETLHGCVHRHKSSISL